MGSCASASWVSPKPHSTRLACPELAWGGVGSFAAAACSAMAGAWGSRGCSSEHQPFHHQRCLHVPTPLALQPPRGQTCRRWPPCRMPTACCAAPLTRGWQSDARGRGCPCWPTAPWPWGCCLGSTWSQVAGPRRPGGCFWVLLGAAAAQVRGACAVQLAGGNGVGGAWHAVSNSSTSVD
jgi:hypothetical protein